LRSAHVPDIGPCFARLTWIGKNSRAAAARFAFAGTLSEVNHVRAAVVRELRVARGGGTFYHRSGGSQDGWPHESEEVTDLARYDMEKKVNDALLHNPADSKRRLKARVARWFGDCFYACGRDGPPAELAYQGRCYRLARVLKHDFLAATCLYEAAPGADGPVRVIGKIGRCGHFCFFPLAWLGRLVTRKEVRQLQRCAGIEQVPHLLERLRPNIYVYEYIEGASLGEKPELPRDFFENLLAVLQQIHTRRLVHFDLHKPGNILLGKDGQAYIIDFQLSLYIPDRLLVSKRLSAALRRRLQAYDIYHLYKHKRRRLPAELTERERALSTRIGPLLRLHRLIAKPYKLVRRPCLRYLRAKGILKDTQETRACPETDPARWARK